MEKLLTRLVAQTRIWFPQIQPLNSLPTGRVLITGAAGSIGYILTQTLSRISGLHVIAVDWDELRLQALSEHCSVEAVLADVSQPEQWTQYLRDCQWVIHTAAYKDVPFLERQPDAAWRNNVVATQQVIDACIRHGVANFLHLSTDKTVEPENWLGLSKWAAEQLIVARMIEKPPAIAILRLCNVLGSRGSVLERWAKKPSACTITDPDAMRWYIHPDLVVQSVLEWISMPTSGIFVPKHPVGKSVADIWRLFADCCQQSGILATHLSPTGLRAGENYNERLHWPFEISQSGNYTLDTVAPWHPAQITSERPGRKDLLELIEKWRRNNE